MDRVASPWMIDPDHDQPPPCLCAPEDEIVAADRIVSFVATRIGQYFFDV